MTQSTLSRFLASILAKRKASNKMTTVEADLSLYKAEHEAIPFTLANQDAWVDYKEFRPAYPQSMLDLWFDYHRRHGGKFDAAHDVGAGKSIPPVLLQALKTRILVANLVLE